MKYFLDTEFIEGFKKPISWLPTIGRFNKPYHSIQLISIGIVAEDGRTYYAISSEFNPNDANQWVKDNVLPRLGERNFNGHNAATAKLWKSNKAIAQDVFLFVNPDLAFPTFAYNNSDLKEGKPLADKFNKHNVTVVDNYYYAQPEFYAYYADYDWVVFCSLFGTMMDLPKGFPMYCRDLKQMFDEKAAAKNWFYGRDIWSNTSRPNDELQSGDYPASLDDKIKKLKTHQDYPDKFNEHNALSDAKWNFELYKFLISI